MKTQWTNLTSTILAISAAFWLVGCTSSVEKVTNKNAPTIEQVYDQYTTGDQRKIADRKAELLRRPATRPDTQLGLPPYPERLAHLYPALPNPELFMYVRPHAVGISGSPIPAYITRFTMYERQPYALPGESLDSLKIHVDDHLAHPRVTDVQPKNTQKRTADIPPATQP